MGELLKLVDRVEALEAPDRGIDWEIHCRDGLDGVGMYGDHPTYTASIDAAMTLVPEGMRVNLSEWDDEEHLRRAGPWQCILSVAGTCHANPFDARCDHAATPALALTAAALRARHD